MRTCPKCGCYIPDNWINCPACDVRITPVFSKKKTEWNTWKDGTRYAEEKLYEDSPLTTYRVKIYYKDDTMTDAFFGMYEHALKHAKNTIDKFWYCVQFVEVWDCYTQTRVGLFYPNS